MVIIDRPWKIVDLDNDQIADTIFKRVLTRMRDSIKIRSNTLPAYILWGDASPQSADDRDTTLFDLAHKKKLSSATRVYDADGDGYKDIVVSYWWGDSATKKVHERTWAFRGGADLREEQEIEQNSPSQAFGNASFAERVTQNEYSTAARIGIGGFAIRERPYSSSFEKRKPFVQETELGTYKVSLKASPNPASEILHIIATGLTTEENLSLRITDAIGRDMLTLSVTKVMLESSLALQIQKYVTGQYTIVLQSEGSVISSTQIIIQK